MAAIGRLLPFSLLHRLAFSAKGPSMGLNIIVETVQGVEHPIWDGVRRGPDRDIAAIIKTLPVVQSEDFEGDVLLRPADFSDWRGAAPSESEARARYLELVDILEAEPEYWLHLSY